MSDLFSEVYGFDTTEQIKKRVEFENTEVPNINEDLFSGRPDSKYAAGANRILHEAFCKDIMGTDFELPANQQNEQDERLITFCKSQGKVGQKLAGLRKVYSSLPEAMAKMVETFREFFTVEDRELLEKAISSLDLPAFFSILNARVYNAAV